MRSWICFDGNVYSLHLFSNFNVTYDNIRERCINNVYDKMDKIHKNVYNNKYVVTSVHYPKSVFYV